jgi:hypothetical protein
MARSDMYRKLPWRGGNPREVSEVVNNLVEGKSNNTGTITLNTSGATSTIINDERIGRNSVILLMATNKESASTSFQLPHGLFEDDTNQSFTANTPTVLAIADEEKAYGMSLASNQITVDYAGCYDIDVMARFENPLSQIHNAYVWFRINGTDVAHSCQSVTIPDKQGSVNGAALVYIKHPLDLVANDYVEIVAAVDDANVTLTKEDAISSPYVRPAVPSLTITMCMAFPSQTSGTGIEPYISARSKGQATITHLPNSVANNTYDYVIIG